MEILNRFKSGASSLIGLIGVIGIVAHITGFYEFPNPEFMNDWWESGIGLIVCAGFFYLKDSEIADFIRQAWNTLMSLFKKKAE